MSQFEWSKEKFSVYVADMDEQHKEWLAIINELHTCLMTSKTDLTTDKVLKKMINYTRYHFAEEERLMRDEGYPHYDAHIRAHAHFTSKLMELKKAVDAGELLLRRELMGILKNWLTDHIQNTDRLYGQFIMENSTGSVDEAPGTISPDITPN
ncbi:MAG: bacteriohemerythrin [Pseudomonadota bacterium]